MRKLVRTPPISTAAAVSRGNPPVSMPTSVDVPPISAISASLAEVRYAAPRMLLAGPLPIVSTGWETAYSSAISVPSFWAKNATASSLWRTRASCSAEATARATAFRAALSTVACSRSKRPSEPISWLREIGTSGPSVCRATCSASSSWRGGDRREHAGDGHRLGRIGDALEKTRCGLGIEGDDVAAVQLDTACDHRFAGRHRGAQVGRPWEQRSYECRGGRADPDHGDLQQLTPFEHGVGGVGGAEHHVGDAIGVHLAGGHHRPDRLHDPGGDVGRGRLLGLGQHAVIPIQHHRIGVRSADVDAEPQVELAAGHSCSTGTKSKS